MKWLLRAVTVLFVLCLSAVAVLVYERLRSTPGPERMLLARGESSSRETLGQFSRLPRPRPAPELSVTTLQGETVKLADFRGRLVLVNLWATWCGPCVEEMPSLARLQAKLPDLAILAISEDRQGARVVREFIARHGLHRLAVYLDPHSDASEAFGVRGLPTSILIGADGRMLGRLEGAADWDAPDMLALLKFYALGRS
jgi:thiol-disulfide isomerase/thioredoxin